MEIDQQLKSIQAKLQLVVKQSLLLQKENARLSKDLEKAQLTIKQQSEQFNNLQQKADALKLGVHQLSNDEKIELEKRIDVYLKEVEKCLALLNA
jgi:hypothetical protein